MSNTQIEEGGGVTTRCSVAPVPPCGENILVNNDNFFFLSLTDRIVNLLSASMIFV